MTTNTSRETYRIVRQGEIYLVIGNSNDSTIKMGTLSACLDYCERMELQVVREET